MASARNQDARAVVSQWLPVKGFALAVVCRMPGYVNSAYRDVKVVRLGNFFVKRVKHVPTGLILNTFGNDTLAVSLLLADM
ncbi:MAG TPA: hypothetical protein VGI71_23110 [Scandinavium sp.]|jgi:hypothetical protein